MSDLNERLAQEAAELINGGEWRDGKWYSDGHRDAWRRALKPAASRIEKLEAALSLAENWMSNRAVHFGELCTSKQCVCGKALVLFNVLQALEGKDG